MNYADDFVLTLFTNDPALARDGDRAGIERIGIDMESIGKAARQSHLATWISDHAETDLRAIRPALSRARLFARCNPVHAGLQAEVDRLIDAGVAVIMLPYFRGVDEAERFIRAVDARAHPVLLVETADAGAVVPELCRIDGVEEIHVGLNDMRLSLGWPSHFHVLVSDFLERICDTVRAAGLRLGVGGLGRAGDNALPIPADLVAAQMVRLGARAALVSRSFFRAPMPDDLPAEIRKLRDYLDFFSLQQARWHAQRRDELARLADTLFGSSPAAVR